MKYQIVKLLSVVFLSIGSVAWAEQQSICQISDYISYISTPNTEAGQRHVVRMTAMSINREGLTTYLAGFLNVQQDGQQQKKLGGQLVQYFYENKITYCDETGCRTPIFSPEIKSKVSVQMDINRNIVISPEMHGGRSYQMIADCKDNIFYGILNYAQWGTSEMWTFSLQKTTEEYIP